MDKLKHGDLSHQVIGAAMRVHTELGPGLLESAYEVCLAHLLREEGLRVDRQRECPIHFRGIQIDAGNRLDLVVEQTLIVELKAKAQATDVDRAQLLSYMKLAKLDLGLLINFHVMHLRDGLERLVL